jgi:hypothetical protein
MIGDHGFTGAFDNNDEGQGHSWPFSFFGVTLFHRDKARAASQTHANA